MAAGKNEPETIFIPANSSGPEATIKVPVGYRFNVRVNRDILFESPYVATAG